MSGRPEQDSNLRPTA